MDPENIHPTNTKWIVWYHNPSDKNWDIGSYKDIIEISSLEDFCVLKNSWHLCLPKTNQGMFFIMRKTENGCIYPRWEDKNNQNGGYWSFKVSKENSDEAWFRLMTYLFGEYITKDEINIMDINGISVSPKKNFCIFKIWNKNSNKNNKDLLFNFDFLNMDEVIYSNHNNNIKKDQLKTNRYNRKNNRDNNRYNNRDNDRYNRKKY